MAASRRHLAPASFAALALLGGAADSGAKELWAQGGASLELSGSLRQIALYTKQTDADDFEGAYCPLASDLADCSAWDELGETHVGQALTRLRVRLDLQATSWLSAAVAYDNQAFYGRIDTLESVLGASFVQDSFFGAEGKLRKKPKYPGAHSSSVLGLAFSQDGRLLFSAAGEDDTKRPGLPRGELSIWSMRTRRELAKLKSDDLIYRSVILNGRYAITAALRTKKSGLIERWDVGVPGAKH